MGQALETEHAARARQEEWLQWLRALTPTRLATFVDEANDLSRRVFDENGTCLRFLWLNSECYAEEGVKWRDEVEIGCEKVHCDLVNEFRLLHLAQFHRLVSIIREHVHMDVGSVEASDLLTALRRVDTDWECLVCAAAPIDEALPCGHAYCCACLAAWDASQKGCPVCRQVPDSTEESYVLADGPTINQIGALLMDAADAV